jgi:hypothetical protein
MTFYYTKSGNKVTIYNYNDWIRLREKKNERLSIQSKIHRRQ